VGILGIIGGLAGGMIISLVAGRNFEKATGDVLGASNEISRMIALVIMILVVTGLII
jgi:adenosylcobinamide-GDP ribazoletransferase